MPMPLPSFPMPWKSGSSTRSVMWLLALLIVLFFTGMLLLSHLNLSYSQQSLAELRRQQIQDVFLAGLTRIDARQRALEHHTRTLAQIGETFQRLSLQAGAGGQARNRLRRELEFALDGHLRDFDGAAGAGIWFEPGILASVGTHYALYSTSTGSQREPAAESATGPGKSYREQPWFERALGSDWSLEQHTSDRIYWSPVYFDFATDRAVLTLASPMFGKNGKLIGLVTTDWASAQIVDLVSRVEVTANSFAFLNDRNNRNLSSLSQSDDTLLEQKIIDAVLALQLPAEVGRTPDSPVDAASLQRRELDVEGMTYELYYATTPAGMVYGAGVPRDEIDRILAPMRDVNYRILISTGAVLLILSLYLLYRILQLVRELQASYTDSLTRLPNRARLLKDLEARRDACLFIINLDRFKEINSLFGHACGDQVLLTVAGHLRSFIKTRSRGLKARIYRLPGDEFALLGQAIPEPLIRAHAEALCSFLRSHRVYWEQQPLSVDASAGIACRGTRESGDSPDKLFSQATIALLLAREQMRNYLIYDPQQEVEKDYEQNLYWAQRLKDALELDQIVPHFQPIHDNRLNRISKYECLARMQDGDRGAITAGHFLGIANKLRLNRQITKVMIEKSFARFLNEPYEFSINLSYADLIDSEILELILSHLRASEIGRRVIFEILESDGIANYSEVKHFVEKIKPFGCKVAVDDFGTGYSNFAHLLQLNVDIIKIDGSLIRYVDEDRTAFLVTQGIVSFARSLGIKTVAEYVHSEAVQARVIELNIDFSQGAHFSMPSAALSEDAPAPA